MSPAGGLSCSIDNVAIGPVQQIFLAAWT